MRSRFPCSALTPPHLCLLPLIELVVERFEHDPELVGRGGLVVVVFGEHAENVLLLDLLERPRLSRGRLRTRYPDVFETRLDLWRIDDCRYPVGVTPQN